MSLNPLLKTALGAAALYAAPRLVAYSYRHRQQLLTPGQLQSLATLGEKLSAPAKAVPAVFRHNATWLQSHRDLAIGVHTMLVLAHITNQNFDATSFHLFLLPWFWNDLANLVEKTPTLIKYTAEVIHDNQWICHIAFCYFFFNGQIAAKSGELLYQYAKCSVGGAIALDMTKSLATYLLGYNELKFFLANRFYDQYLN